MAEPEVFLTVPEVARLLRLPRASVYKLIACDHIPGTVRLSARRIRVKQSDLDAFIKRGGVAA